jgi:cytochrome c oxidase subunit 2
MLEFLGKWMPPNGSAHGPQIDQLIGLLHWLMAVLFVGWALYFIYVLFRFRASKNPQASYEGSRSHFSSYIEIGVVVIEAVLLIGFAIPAWAKWVTPHEDEANTLMVRVIAEQFAWNVQYPGADGVFGRRDIDLVDSSNPLGLDRSDPNAKDDITTINQLHLPVDRPVTIMLSSKDVIHSFFLPHMRVKQDTIPGMEIPIHFKPIMTTPGEAQFPGCAANKTCWEIACAQLCGLGHYRMRGFYQIHSQESFDTWMAQKVAALAPAG